MGISLCIPAYNAALTLPRLLISAHAQEIPFEEIIVYDDASTDATSLIAEEYGAVVIKCGNNVGCSVAKNKLLEASSQDWIHFHDADDLLLSNFTSLSHTWINKTSCPDVILFDYEYRDNETEALIATSDFSPDELEKDPLRYAILNQINPFCGLYRRTKLMNIGGYDTDPLILYNEDVAFHCKLAASGLSFSAEKQVSIINYRMASSMSSNNQVRCLLAHVEVMTRLVKTVGDRYPLELKAKLWGAAGCLAAYSQWNDVKSAVYAASGLDAQMPSTISPAFSAMAKILGPYWAFLCREILIRLFKPELRSLR